MIEEFAMYTATRLKGVRHAGARCAAWLFLFGACAVLFSGCATPPESESPSPEPEQQAGVEPKSVEISPPPVAEPQPAEAGKTGEAPGEQAAPRTAKAQSKSAQKAEARKPTPVVKKRPAPKQDAKAPPGEEDAGCGAAKTGKEGPKPAVTGPQPRWVCKQPLITHEPSWGGDWIEYEFAIGNEGEADLQIKLKGG